MPSEIQEKYQGMSSLMPPSDEQSIRRRSEKYQGMTSVMPHMAQKRPRGALAPDSEGAEAFRPLTNFGHEETNLSKLSKNLVETGSVITARLQPGH